ncbi:bifunctional ADP-dependent NAD(P)H-hydrate dehydratase/NAD(P)H-hydrate epimerase [Limisalsivibrio acetivorans]|uniref:bifunctional ADP-dependent NAD(P)H-hydrate dehydratase/NAD(P)H-hydrate epimerase n=1 Tax=Limisalsivibrio acetivorans TaxID=1304888 RepID=UPI0003B639EE|nr:bifunctional ADP-dependent NAD(P)H-hydrate dehydratase/NAD(P)H-hydrate epimerase [Limisalsivibrio acetivorans]
MEILSSAQMGEADRYTIEEIGIPSAVLMENAARSVYEFFESLDIDKDSIAVVCGGGNNGGDGLALARLLINAGFDTDIFLASNPEKLKGDAKLNYDILTKYPARIYEIDEEPSFPVYDVVFDAIFGTGLSRPAEGRYTDIIEAVNISPAFVISIDIPSGLYGSSHQVPGTVIKADATVTFCRPKIPHCMFPAKKYCGETVITDISIPDFAVDKTECSTFLISPFNLPLFPPREPDAHKGSYGHALIMGGSTGKSGAAVIASLACARTGAGLTTCMLPGKLNGILDNLAPEIMSHPVGDTDYFDIKHFDDAISTAGDKTVIAAGPGIGREKSIGDFLKAMIFSTKQQIVIDADGLWHLDSQTLEKLRFRAILTPHIGEFAKLTGLSNEEVLENRLELAGKFAVEKGVTLVLKSADTLIALPDGRVFVNSTGSPALAKGGSGDCLAGIITGLLAQGFSPEDAAKLGCWAMGRTAEILAEETRENHILTGDIVDNLWAAFSELDFQD